MSNTYPHPRFQITQMSKRSYSYCISQTWNLPTHASPHLHYTHTHTHTHEHAPIHMHTHTWLPGCRPVSWCDSKEWNKVLSIGGNKDVCWCVQMAIVVKLMACECAAHPTERFSGDHVPLCTWCRKVYPQKWCMIVESQHVLNRHPTKVQGRDRGACIPIYSPVIHIDLGHCPWNGAEDWGVLINAIC